MTAEKVQNNNKMEPVTTSKMVGAVAGYLAQTLKDQRSVQDFFSDFTDAAVQWVRPLFLTDDGQPKEVIEDLQQDPEDKLNTDAVENTLAKALKKEPSAEALLQTMYKIIQAKAAAGQTISITHSKNVVTGNISTTGNVIIGDNNS